ncbi:hypothetical protein [Legionella jamestowniensis]|uniref:Gala protein type 1, 3 or 4 n=1 Tax=Legionella jamestowniensis TaxID=455 RepID=A0A0W0UYT3_9GAMM|nr:hypothetical protein [Legionella jamestowniensis]KTD13038.1 Gala protein type 1, 3 or 4 [Legionella jamestowniensis]SFL79832.1 Ran GTPase-activating protein (RanGAP) involved in mRNA processing and transport [Legionella jamestowniensis DSM 19215]
MPLEFLIPHENNPPIRSLELNGSGVDDNSLRLLSEELKTNKTVTSIDLSLNDFSSEGVRSFSDTLKTDKMLTDVNLSDNKIGPDGAKYLSQALKFNFTLLKLNISNSDSYLALGVLGIQYLCELIKTNHSLARVDFSYNDIQPPSTKVLSEALKINYGLTNIALKGNPLGPKGIQDICEALKINHGISIINLANTGMEDAGSEFVSEIIKGNKSLTDIELGCNQISFKGAKTLSEALRSNTTLLKLSLRSNPLGPVGAHHLSKAIASNNTLTELNLSTTDLGDIGVKDIAEALVLNQSLTVVSLVYNEISDAGVQYLCEALKINKSLKTLNLSYNNISDKGIKSLCEVLKVNNTLTTIHLDLNPNITQDGIKALKEALKTNYTLLEVTGIDDPVIKQYLKRNNAIATCFKNFTTHLTEGLQSEDLEKNLSLLEESIQPNMPTDHYLRECYRLLTALGHLTNVGSEIAALTNLLPPYTHPFLQTTANLALSLLLCTDLSQQLDQLGLQEKRCQLLLHGFNDVLQRPELNNFCYIALFHLVYPNQSIIQSEFDSFKKNTALLNQDLFKNIIQEALVVCQKSNSPPEEINFLKAALAQLNYPVEVAARLTQSPAFLLALRNKHPEATYFTLVEHAIPAHDSQTLLIPINQIFPAITQQTTEKLEDLVKPTSTYRTDIKAKIHRLKQTLFAMFEKKSTTRIVQSNLSFFADNGSHSQANSSKSNLSKEQLQQIKELISSLQKEISSFWPYPNKDIKQIKVNALDSLIKKTETMTISEAIDEIDSEYPQARSGQISTRTADLFNNLRNTHDKIPGSF